MSVKIGVAGVSGYAGAELIKLILQHPNYISGEVEIGALTANNQAGKIMSEVNPHLVELQDYCILPTETEVFKQHDYLFLALPPGVSTEIDLDLINHTRIIDCSADHRIENENNWQRYYPEIPYLKNWVYGLPELPNQRNKIQAAQRVAIPGCFATAIMIGLIPIIVANKIISPINITAATGTSGSGKILTTNMLASEILNSITPYKITGTHRHNAELIEQLTKLTSIELKINFTPLVVPIPRGILAVINFQTNLDETELLDIYNKYYLSEPFVKVLSNSIIAKTHSVIGSNMVHLSVHLNNETRTATVVSVIDNLMKGTAGTAIQVFNLLNDWPETAGLPLNGIYP